MKRLRALLTKFDLFSWYLNLIDALIPQKIKENRIEDFNRARFLVGPPIITATIGILYFFFYYNAGDYYTAAIVSIPIFTLPVVIWIFRLTGAITVISNLIILSFITTLFFMTFKMGGFMGPPLLWFILVPIMATGTLGRKPAYIWTIICCLILIFLYATQDYINFPNLYKGKDLFELLYLTCLLGLLVLVFLFAVLYEAFKDYAIDRLYESESSFRNFYETSLVGLWRIKMPEGSFIRANRATASMLGYKSEDELIKNCYPYKLSSPETKTEYLNKLKKSGTLNDFDMSFSLADNKKVSVSVSAVYYPEKNYIEGSILEITDRKKIESDLRNANRDLENEILKRGHLQKLAHDLNVLKENLLAPADLEERLNLITKGIIESFTDAAFAGIWVFKEGDKCEKCLHIKAPSPNIHCTTNENCLHLLAYSGTLFNIKNGEFTRIPRGRYQIGELVLTKNSKFITNNVFEEKWEGGTNWAKKIGIVAYSSYKLVSSDQSSIGVLAVLNRNPFSPYEDMQLEGIANAASNIIQIEKAEEKLKKTRNQLIEAEKMSALGNLVAGVSHEINTPIGISVTASSYIEDSLRIIEYKMKKNELNRSDLENQMQKIIETSSMIQKNLKRASDLIKSFKQVAVDRSNERKRKFNLKDFFDELLISIYYLYKRTNHQIEILCPDQIELDSYPGAYSQIITNFIMNSLTHGFSEIEGGQIKMNIFVIKNILNIHYSDNGKGMNEKTVTNIFDPFYTTNRDKGGTGLGMTIVFNLITQKLKGEINCSSSPGNGAKFKIRIPLPDEDENTDSKGSVNNNLAF